MLCKGNSHRPVWLDPVSPLHSWGWYRLFSFFGKEAKGLSRLFWEVLVFRLLIPLSHYWTMLQNMRGTGKPSTDVCWSPTVCQILKSKNRPSVHLPETYLWKEDWDQGSITLSPSLSSFIHLNVIGWLLSISESHFAHLQNGRSKNCPAFSFGLSFGLSA